MKTHMHLTEGDPGVLMERVSELADKAGWKLITVVAEQGTRQAPHGVTSEYTAFLERSTEVEGGFKEILDAMFDRPSV